MAKKTFLDFEQPIADLEEKIEELRPEKTSLAGDDSPQYRRTRLFLESLLRRTPPVDERIYLGHQGALNPAPYQLEPAHLALKALRNLPGRIDGLASKRLKPSQKNCHR